MTMDIETRRKISRSMKGKSNFEGKRHSHATKLQIGFSQEGHRNVKDHKWVTDKETGEESRVKGNKPKGTRWGRSRRSFNEMVNDPCWKTHKMVGMKKKNGKMVPNCVPESTQMAEQDNKKWKTETPWMKSKKDVTDKSGAVHTPMSRARNLARMALKSKKQREEVKEASIYSSSMAGRGQTGMVGKKPNASDMPSYGTYNVTVKHEGGEKTYKLKAMKDHKHAVNVASKLHAKDNPGQKIKDVSHVKEDTAVNEVSKQLMGRYIEKAATSMSTAAFGQGQASASRRPPSEKDQKTGSKRMAGIARATSKLTKEETLEEAKATYCGRCGTTHVAPKFGGKCPALKESMSPVTKRVCALLSKK